MFRTCALLATGLLFASCEAPQQRPGDRVCMLTQSTEQVFQEGVVQSNSLQKISYNAQGLPITYSYKLGNSDSTYTIEYQGSTAVKAANSSGTQMVFQYNASNQLARVTCLVKGQERAVSTLEYKEGRLSRVQELWRKPLSGTLVTQREFTFLSDDRQNAMQTQRLVQTGPDGVQTEEEWNYSFDGSTHRSPYADVNQITLLTLMMLTNPADPLPGRLLQRVLPTGYQRYRFQNGQRVLGESAVFKTEFDPFLNPSIITIDLTTSGASARRLVQTYQYLCLE